jgi:hypothetical protein
MIRRHEADNTAGEALEASKRKAQRQKTAGNPKKGVGISSKKKVVLTQEQSSGHGGGQVEKEEESDSDVCEICGLDDIDSGDDVNESNEEGTLLICDGCDMAFHLFCLGK